MPHSNSQEHSLKRSTNLYGGKEEEEEWEEEKEKADEENEESNYFFDSSLAHFSWRARRRNGGERRWRQEGKRTRVERLRSGRGECTVQKGAETTRKIMGQSHRSLVRHAPNW